MFSKMKGQTLRPLMESIIENDQKKFDDLIKKVTPDELKEENEFFYHTKDPDYTPRVYCTPLMAAAALGQDIMLKSLIKYTGNINQESSGFIKRGSTALSYACQLGKSKCVSLLLAAKANPNNAVNRLSTPLLSAIGGENILEEESENIINDLVKHRANIDFVTTSGNSALMTAVYNQNVKAVELILKLSPSESRATINLFNSKTTPLHSAARQGNVEIMKLLLANPHTRIDIADREWRLPLVTLLSNIPTSEACVELLLKDPRMHADDKELSLVNRASHDGLTPLLWAAHTACSPNIMRTLLDYKADINSVPTSHFQEGKSALHLASQHYPSEKSRETIMLLLNRGINEDLIKDAKTTAIKKFQEHDTRPLTPEEQKIHENIQDLMDQVLEYEGALRSLSTSDYKKCERELSNLNMQKILEFQERFSPEQVEKWLKENKDLTSEQYGKLARMYQSSYYALDSMKALRDVGDIRASKTIAKEKAKEIKTELNPVVTKIDQLTDRAYQSMVRVEDTKLLSPDLSMNIAWHMINNTNELVKAYCKEEKDKMKAPVKIDKEKIAKNFKERGHRFMQQAALQGNRDAFNYMIKETEPASVPHNERLPVLTEGMGTNIEQFKLSDISQKLAKLENDFNSSPEKVLVKSLKTLNSALSSMSGKPEAKSSGWQQIKGLDDSLEELRHEHQFVSERIMPPVREVLNHLSKSDLTLDYNTVRLALWCNVLSDYCKYLQERIEDTSTKREEVDKSTVTKTMAASPLETPVSVSASLRLFDVKKEEIPLGDYLLEKINLLKQVGPGEVNDLTKAATKLNVYEISLEEYKSLLNKIQKLESVSARMKTDDHLVLKAMRDELKKYEPKVSIVPQRPGWSGLG